MLKYLADVGRLSELAGIRHIMDTVQTYLTRPCHIFKSNYVRVGSHVSVSKLSVLVLLCSVKFTSKRKVEFAHEVSVFPVHAQRTVSVLESLHFAVLFKNPPDSSCTCTWSQTIYLYLNSNNIFVLEVKQYICTSSQTIYLYLKSNYIFVPEVKQHNCTWSQTIHLYPMSNNIFLPEAQQYICT